MAAAAQGCAARARAPAQEASRRRAPQSGGARGQPAGRSSTGACRTPLPRRPSQRTGSRTRRGFLAERLSRLGLQEVEQVGDGNCQFRAISHQLYDTPSWHVLVRRKVVAQMKQDSDYYRGFLAEEFESYAEEMSRTGTWGDELTLRAAADCLGITIHVVTSDPENWYIVYEPKERLLEKEAFLSYIAPIHFNSITKA
uniref:Otu-like cysteine protease domain-containing n=1 Tax=Tetraselmis sp. GSL018 TaxID=582737 RepID=A0A061RL72_9CHLO